MAEAVPEATPSGPKTAVAHLRFQRGSVFKVGGQARPAAPAHAQPPAAGGAAR